MSLESMVNSTNTFIDLENCYKGKRVLVTGHTGFKGSWLISILHGFGAIIKGYALAPENEVNLYSEISGNNLCESEINDLRNRSSLKRVVTDFQPDFVFHLAAQPLVRLSYEIPSETFEVNVIGTANLLDSIRLLEKKCIVILITTDKVYYNIESDHYYTENDRLGGYDPYSASKACCELLIDSYKNSFFNFSKYQQHQKSIAVCRAGNVIGGGDWSRDRLIPDIVKALHSNKNVSIRNPAAIRPWQHVIEPLFGYLDLGLKLTTDPMKYAEAYNFGPNKIDTLSVEEMVIKSISCWKSGTYSIEKNDELHEAGLLMLDISKVMNELNWKPILSAEEAIERTINWYKSYYKGVSATYLLKADIEYYNKKRNG
jgi:CDP-glucose 4,6-dehydratase